MQYIIRFKLKGLNIVSEVRHLVIMGYQLTDKGKHTEVCYMWHVASGPQTERNFVEIGKYKRDNMRYVVWASRVLDRRPSQEAQLELVKSHLSYTLNPFDVE